MPSKLDRAVRDAYRDHRDALWGLCYRMTGSVSDADELVQEAFLRLRERPPDDLDRSLRGWLVTVAANLCRDHLRTRRETPYESMWLPAPVRTGEGDAWAIAGLDERRAESPEQRLRRRESLSYAFLVAIESLTPNQRAVVLFRDVYGASVRQTAEALGLSESNVKTTHHRARKRLSNNADAPVELGTTVDDEGKRLLARLVRCLEEDDFDELAHLLRDDVVLATDGGDGEFSAATRPVVGAERVGRFIQGLHEQSQVDDLRIDTLNGQPALLIELHTRFERQAPRAVLHLAPSHNQIAAMYIILASDKIAHLFEGR